MTRFEYLDWRIRHRDVNAIQQVFNCIMADQKKGLLTELEECKLDSSCILLNRNIARGYTMENTNYTFKQQTPEHKKEMKRLCEEALDAGFTPDELIDMGDYLLGQMSLKELQGQKDDDKCDKKKGAKKKDSSKATSGKSSSKKPSKKDSGLSSTQQLPKGEGKPKGKNKGKKGKKKK